MQGRLELLRRSLHGEDELDVITQCEIVAEATANGAPYMENLEGLALYLELSKNHVYKMMRVARDLLPELKDYFAATAYQPHTAFNVSRLDAEGQRRWLEDAWSGE